MTDFWAPSGPGKALQREDLERLFDEIKNAPNPCEEGHMLLDFGPSLDLCQCAGCLAFFPRPGGARKPGASQWEDRR